MFDHFVGLALGLNSASFRSSGKQTFSKKVHEKGTLISSGSKFCFHDKYFSDGLKSNEYRFNHEVVIKKVL